MISTGQGEHACIISDVMKSFTIAKAVLLSDGLPAINNSEKGVTARWVSNQQVRIIAPNDTEGKVFADIVSSAKVDHVFLGDTPRLLHVVNRGRESIMSQVLTQPPPPDAVLVAVHFDPFDERPPAWTEQLQARSPSTISEYRGEITRFVSDAKRRSSISFAIVPWPGR